MTIEFTCKLRFFSSLYLPSPSLYLPSLLSIPSLYRHNHLIESNVEYENNNPPVTPSEEKDEDGFTSTDASELVGQNLNPRLDEEQQWQGRKECKSQNNASDAINQTDAETIQNKTNHLLSQKQLVLLKIPPYKDLGSPIREQITSVNLLTKPTVESNFHKACLAVIRSKEGQSIWQKLQQSRSHPHTLSSQEEIEEYNQLWKLFHEKLAESAYDTTAFSYPLPEDAVLVSYDEASPVPGFPALLVNYAFNQTPCSVRGGNSLASAIVPKIRAKPSSKLKQGASIKKPLQHAHTPAVEPQASSASIKTGPTLAISPDAMAELKAGSKDYSRFNNNLKTFAESVSSQQTTLHLDVHVLAALEALPPTGLPEAPYGRQVPKDPHGKGQSGKSSYEGKQSHEGTTSSSALSSGSSGVGGGSDAGGDRGGDRDPPKRTGRRDDVKPDRKAEEEGEEEEESDSDDEPRPKPQNEQKLSGVSSAAEGESNQERREQNDSGTNVQPPVPTTHSDFAVDETNPEPSLNAVGPLAVPAQNQTEQKSGSRPPHSRTPLMFPGNASPPHISPQPSPGSSPPLSPLLETNPPPVIASPTDAPVSPHPSSTFPQPHTEYSFPELTSYDNSPMPFSWLAGDSTTAHSLSVTDVNSEDDVRGTQSPSSTQQVSTAISLPRLSPASSSYSVTSTPDPIHDDSASSDGHLHQSH